MAGLPKYVTLCLHSCTCPATPEDSSCNQQESLSIINIFITPPIHSLNQASNGGRTEDSQHFHLVEDEEVGGSTVPGVLGNGPPGDDGSSTCACGSSELELPVELHRRVVIRRHEHIERAVGPHELGQGLLAARRDRRPTPGTTSTSASPPRTSASCSAA
uniref:Uncharacterized protein n=1 Tax=Aegilops tauschii subsp. strangulata TaxID=200361 RepID=A0A453HW96_AEGTS